MIPNEFWIVVSERDNERKEGFLEYGPPRGPLVHEGYCVTREQAEARARNLGTRYGWVHIMKVESDRGHQQ